MNPWFEFQTNASTIGPANGRALLLPCDLSPAFDRVPTECSMEKEATPSNRISPASSPNAFDHLEQQVAERAKELAALNTIAVTVSQYLDLDQVLNNALDVTLQVMGIEAGGIYLLDEKADLLVVRALRGFSAKFAAAIDGLRVGEGYSGRVIQTGKPIIVKDISQDERLSRVAEWKKDVHSMAIIPLSSKGKTLGVMFVATEGTCELVDSEFQLLISIGRQIGVAVDNARLFKAEQRRAEQFRLIGEVSRHIISILDVDQLLEEIVRQVNDILGYYLVGIGLVEGDEIVARTGIGPYWENGQREPVRLKIGQEGITGWVAATGECLLVPDVTKEPHYYHVPEITETRSELAVPLRVKEQVIGVLDVQSRRLAAFDEGDVVVLQSLADQAAMAIENARLFAIEQRRADQFRAINQVGRRITSILDTDELLSQMVELIREMLGYPIVGIGLVEGDELVFRAGVAPRGKLPVDVRIKVGTGVTGWVAVSGESFLVPDVSLEPKFVSPVPVSSRSELAVPMKTKDAVIGVLNVESENLNAFDESDRIVLESLANQAAVAIENARLYEQARLLAVLEERHRLARDLHDSVTQALYGVTLYSEAAAGQLALKNLDRAAAHLRVLRNTAQEALAEMRLLIYELRPPVLEEDGLVAALQARLLAVEGRVGLQTRLKVEGEGRLPSEIEEGLYRIAQEALNNALKHAQAHNISVCLRFAPQGGDVSLDIVDDGAGFDREAVRGKGGLGLSTMKERAAELGGRLSIESWPGEGTRVRVEAPL